MSKSDLALLDRAVQGAIALELGDGVEDKAALAELGIASKRTRIIAGLKVVSNAARDAEVDPKSAKMTDRMLRYRADHGLVVEKLKRVGVVPVAVLPLSAWERICNSAGLYRFQPQDDKVFINADKLVKNATDDAVAEAHKDHRQICFTFMSVAGVVVVFSLIITISISWWGVAGIIIGCLGLFGSGIGLDSFEEESEEVRTLEARNIKAMVALHEHEGTLLKELWPNFHEPQKGLEIRIALPNPPAEVQEQLVAAERARLPLYIAAVAEAVAFKESVVEVLLKERGKQWDEIERQQALKCDPIAYVVEGTAVAIVEQYGDFPIEKDVINEVVNSEHLV